MDICVINKEHYGCFNACIASVAKTWNMEYALMFTSSWGFQYVKQQNNYYEWLGNRIGPGWHSPFSFYLEAYHGLAVTINKISNIDEVLNKIIDELVYGYPVILLSDSFVCPWHKGFGKYHTHACFIIVNVDKENGCFYCIDPSHSSCIEKLFYIDCKEAFNKIIYFRKNDQTKKLHKLKNPIGDAASSYIKSGSVSSMYSFIEELEGYNFLDEFNMFHIDAVPFLNKLKIIEDSRANISEAINYYFNIKEQTDKKLFGYRFLELADKWNNLRKILIKIGVTQRTKDLLRIIEELKLLAKQEELLAYEMVDFFDE